MFDFLISVLTLNWAFIAVAFILGLVGEVVKSLVVGAKDSRFKSLFLRTLPLHPVIAGGLLGCVLFVTVPEVIAVSGLVGSVLYFAASGALSTWIYSTLKSLAPKISKALQAKLGSKPNDDR